MAATSIVIERLSNGHLVVSEKTFCPDIDSALAVAREALKEES